MSAQLVIVIIAMLIAFALIIAGLYFGLVQPNSQKLEKENQALKDENSKLESDVALLETKSNAAYATMNYSALSRFMGLPQNVKDKEIKFLFLPRDGKPKKDPDTGYIQNLTIPIKQGDTFRLGIIGSSVNFSDAYINVLNNETTDDVETTKVPLQPYTIPNFIEMQSPVDFNYIHSIVITPTSGFNLSQFILQIKDGDKYKINIANNTVINQGVNPANGNTNFNPNAAFCYTPTIASPKSTFYCYGNNPRGSTEIGNCNFLVNQGTYECSST